MKKIIIFITLSIVLCSASSFAQGYGGVKTPKKTDQSYGKTLANLSTAQAAVEESDRQLKTAATATATAKANIVTAESTINTLEESVTIAEKNAREAAKKQRAAGKEVKASIADKVKNGEFINCDTDLTICTYNLTADQLKQTEESLKRARKDLDNAENTAEQAEQAYRNAKAAEREAKKRNTQNSKELKKLEEQIAEYERRAEREAIKSDIRDDLNEFHRKHGQVEKAYWKMYSKFEQQKIAAYLRQKLYETLNSKAFCDAKNACGTNQEGKLDPKEMDKIFPITPGSALRPPNSSSGAGGSGAD